MILKDGSFICLSWVLIVGIFCQVWKGRWGFPAGFNWYLCQYSGSCKGATDCDSQYHPVDSFCGLPRGQGFVLLVGWWCRYAYFWMPIRNIWVCKEVGSLLQEIQHWTSGSWYVLCSQDWLLEGQGAAHICERAQGNEGEALLLWFHFCMWVWLLWWGHM